MYYSKQRVANLRQEMAKLHIDGFLVTNPANVKYLSNFTGDEGILLVTENGKYLITDSRFEVQIADENPDWTFIETRYYLKEALEAANKEHLASIGFENTIDYASYDYLDENAVCDIVPFGGVIEDLRSVKDPREIELVKESCDLAGKGYQYVLDNVHPGQTEREVATKLDYFMRMNGASEWSFESIVASGERTTRPHGTFTDKKIENGDLVTLDFGYYLNDYTSDVTRTFGIGKGMQDDKVKEIYDVVLNANQKTIEAVKAGVNGQDLDRIGRDYITKRGYGEYFNHGMGHGIGLSIHELPNVGRTYREFMREGQVITSEPGVYVPGVGGVRIEDDILVTKDGHEVLTDFSKKLIEV